MKKKAFTLIELLVVIAIIALLVSLLMPALNKAREQARMALCLTNQKGLSISWTIYAQENKDQLVSAWTRLTGGFSDPFSWVDYPLGIVGMSPAEAENARKEAIRRGKLFPYTEYEKLYRCASEDRDDLPDGGFNAIRSYSIVGGLNGCLPEDGMDYGIREYRNYGNIAAPANQIAFIEERDPRETNLDSWVMNKTSWIDPVSNWHNERTVFGFVDGHAAPHGWVDAITVEGGSVADWNEWEAVRSRAQVEGTGEDIRWVWQHYPYAEDLSLF